MSTIADALIYLAQIKSEIRDAIRSKGVNVAGNVPFKHFPEHIRLIEGGVTGGTGGFSINDTVNITYMGAPTYEVSETIALQNLPGIYGEDYAQIKYLATLFFEISEFIDLMENAVYAIDHVTVEYTEV